MPELQLDVAIANRFISSLSKSLQALCHGCMDFDSGIEIVGYINVNIDSGSKVDYVLNEKVLKSTTNSMTFVSNSFLAKKDQPKQTRDGACSPIPELRPQPQAMSPYHHSRMRGSHSGSHFHKSASHSSPYSHVLGGAQKRPWAGDWRASPKRQRSQIPSAESLSSPHSQSLNMPQTSGANFQQPPTPSESTDNINSGDNLVNVKKEAIETDEQTSDSPTDSKHVSSEYLSSEGQTGESIFESSTAADIKSDPDAMVSTDNQAPSTENTNADEDSDFKGTFLHPSTSDEGQQQKNDSATEETNDQATTNDELPNFGMSVPESSDDQGQKVSLDRNIAGSSKDETDTVGVGADGEPCGSDMKAGYYQGNDDASYPPTVYSDAGEGSSDAGQFEVIEIDDEDEDVQAMFDDPHRASSSFSRGQHLGHKYLLNTSFNMPVMRHVKSHQGPKETYFVYDEKNQLYACPLCGKEYKSSSGARLHYKIKHFGSFDHYCEVCGKGFQQKSHLKSHMSLHMQQKDFECNICGSQYAHKTSLTAHQKLAHGAVV